MDIDFVISPSEQDASIIYNELVKFNEPYFLKLDRKKIALFIRDEAGNVIGGLTGKTRATSLDIDYFCIPESLRKSGMGSKLLKRLEQEAIKLGVENIFLYTYTFQAPNFYKHLGYIEVGRYTDYPHQGIDMVFLQKRVPSDESLPRVD